MASGSVRPAAGYFKPVGDSANATPETKAMADPNKDSANQKITLFKSFRTRWPSTRVLEKASWIMA